MNKNDIPFDYEEQKNLVILYEILDSNIYFRKNSKIFINKVTLNYIPRKCSIF